MPFAHVRLRGSEASLCFVLRSERPIEDFSSGKTKNEWMLVGSFHDYFGDDSDKRPTNMMGGVVLGEVEGGSKVISGLAELGGLEVSYLPRQS